MIKAVKVTVPEVVSGQSVEVSIVVLDGTTGEVVSYGKDAISGKSSTPFTFNVEMGAA